MTDDSIPGAAQRQDGDHAANTNDVAAEGNNENSSTIRQTAEVTGRDWYICMKALAYGKVLIPVLPEERQEASDRDDMERLLAAKAGDAQDAFLRAARCHLGLEPLFLDEKFEAESRRKLIENFARALGV